jgi:CHAT domain-containing protein
MALAWPFSTPRAQEAVGLALHTQVRKLLKQNEVVLIFRGSGSALELKVMDVEREKTVALPHALSEIQRAQEKLDANIAAAMERDPPLPFDVDAARHIGSSLLLEATRTVRHGSTLIIVPEADALLDIPFHILVVGKDPIIQSYDVGVSPTVELLHQSLLRRSSLLAVDKGTPIYSDKLGAAIARNKHLRMEYMTVFSENATETFVKENLPKAHLVLLAPHGHFDEQDALNSFLLFRPSGPDDGRLYAHELGSIRLKPSLVFLNSCNLGRQLVFPRELLKAGASTVIASYWQPTLKGPSSRIVARVMKYLSEGKTAAYAVSQGQRDMLASMQEPSHPTLWAPFITIGNWR